MDQKERNLYWVWLTQCFPIPSSKVTQILDQTDPVTFYREKTHYSFLTDQDMHTVSSISLEWARAILEDCAKAGARIVTIEDDEYPESLLQIYCPPPVLYVRGSLTCLKGRLSVAAVGSRRSSSYYNAEIGNISFQLSCAGAVVVSGCAVGNDTFAHRGALSAKRPTVSVLACGIDVNYPRESKELKEEILSFGGALVTELPPGKKNDGRYFQARNRLIAGLSDCVLLGQVPMRSGAMITANAAIEQGKEIFCIPPSSISEPSCMGVAGLIRDGARLAFSAYDIISAFSSDYPDTLSLSYAEQHMYMFKEPQEADDVTPGKKKESTIRKRETVKSDEKRETERAESKGKVPSSKEKKPELSKAVKDILLSNDENDDPETQSRRKILTALLDGPITLSELSRICGMKPPALLMEVTQLEMEGLVSLLPGQYCTLV